MKHNEAIEISLDASGDVSLSSNPVNQDSDEEQYSDENVYENIVLV